MNQFTQIHFSWYLRGRLLQINRCWMQFIRTRDLEAFLYTSYTAGTRNGEHVVVERKGIITQGETMERGSFKLS